MIELLDEKVIIDPQEITELQMKIEGTQTRLVFVDASFYLPDTGKNAQELYRKAHIPNAVFWDIRDIKDHASPLPHMLPDKSLYEEKLSPIGIKNNDITIVYGQNGFIMGPCRAWWMLKGFGHKNVMVLNGGLPYWEAQGLPVTDKETETAPSQYKATSFKADSVIDMPGVIAASEKNVVPIIDARPYARFSGESEEPREGMRSGHIPNSISTPCSMLVDEKGCLKSKDEIKNLFKNAGITLGSKSGYITTCGSGVTACALSLALQYIGENNIAVYDGSWSEWGLNTSPTKVAK